MLPRVNTKSLIKNQRIKKRENENGDIQLCGPDILNYVLKAQKQKLKSCLGVFAITDVDLYSGHLNFVFGVAYLRDMVGMQSIARQSPSFYGHYSDDDDPDTLLMKVCRTATHELGHMFGLKHCIYYECLMMGSNSSVDGARKPAFLCAVCY